MGLDSLLTAKQQAVLHTYLKGDFKTMILTGAIRSGKTFIDNLLFLYELRRVKKQAELEGEKHPQYILAGASSGSIYNNVIASLSNQFGIDLRPDRHNHYHLYGVDITPVYTDSIRGLSGARGFTSYGGYINEASLANQEVFQEILNRCSKAGAHVIVDSNPDNPQHWLKTDYIDNDNPKNKTVSFRFTIDDNTFLPADYVQQIKAATPSGMFYERNILGLWVSGDGIVYKDFDKSKMVIPASKIPDDLHVYCGVDWGFEHKGVITVWGDDNDGNVYLLHEYTKQFKFIKYWVDLAKKLQKKYGYNLTFWADSARPDNVTEFQKAGIDCRNANKARMAGVEKVAEFMKTGHFFVNQDGIDCFLDEIYQYVWDENTGEPKKENDDVMDSMRYAVFNEHRNNKTQILNSRYF
ncbi:PBSX family phage terminase large subunit [Limosilactobacillus vaginalis]|uniref:PBSX family phage terminase large subunit n=1 Tax=Limosilactobacillus vaginalis TaxID=1633 RepID=A0ABT4K9D0_9LACO|nr:PBSX family phage terminase large subunit [Limosilactobacillus vaginalis]MCZ3746554.1 PBSX family phage terminase large subunit [Limosilactobacillus vaginalis]MCZ3751554.1 PBSX family phage terminase large subunit [Limosilactobacillus vaginalis]MCZ3753240.1 PBSX family phage terminase large subunit [Limosilactobacillus vaginalis]MCZ3755074.1 PBSX family phage terminase large subunit [Limosilactobacillus vaginalis]MCZ3756726.1 PBSX family phage terminase large subunit [Limosilactobacillus va